MNLLKIFPAAAGVIALSATVGFARDLREMEEEDFSRVLIVSVDPGTDTGAAANDTGRHGHVYHVAINRGDNKWLVKIDACTGKILDKRDVTVATV